MAGYRKRNGKWEVRIRRNNSKNLSKTFINKEDALRWAREQESRGDLKLKDELIKLASETPDEEFDLDLIQTLSRYVQPSSNKIFI
jgi:hypothetical protein